MKFLWFLLHIVVLSAFTDHSAKSQMMEPGITRTAQAETLDAKKVVGGTPSNSAKSLPAIVPEAKAIDELLSAF